MFLILLDLCNTERRNIKKHFYKTIFDNNFLKFMKYNFELQKG